MNKREINQILSYVERMESEKKLKYDLDEEGLWEVIGGTIDELSRSREALAQYEG